MPAIILSLLIISLVPVLVGLSATKIPHFTSKALRFLVSFAAGVMLANAFFDLLPESIDSTSPVAILNVTLAGLVFFFLMEKYFLWHCHAFGTHTHKSTTFLVMFGDTLHNFIDGIVVAGAFLASPLLGITTAVAIALHEIPQELADFSVLVSEGVKSGRAIYLNFASGLVAVLGGIAGYYFLEVVQGAIPYFTAFASGMFIYISCSDLIPKSHEIDRKNFDFKTAISFICGIAVIKVFAVILG